MSEIPSSEVRTPAGEVYRAFWRWHFYAGLLVLPILMLMALTGGVYLFKTELTAIIHRPLVVVADRPARAPPSAWIASAETGAGAKATQLIIPSRGDRSVQVMVGDKAHQRTAYVDPHDGGYLGVTTPGGVMGVIKRVHSLDIAGPVMNGLVEVVAGWAIVLVATGVFLWWPRGQNGGVVTVRGGPARRLFWRDLHAVTGAFAGIVIVFLAATGMPWSIFWGKEVRQLPTEAGWGRPKPPIAERHHPVKSVERDGVPWALGAHAPPNTPNPSPMLGMSANEHARMMQAKVLGVDDIVAKARADGLTDGFTLTLPQAPGGTWTASYMPDHV